MGIVQPPDRQPRVHRIRRGDNGFQVVRYQHLEHPTDKRPRRLAVSDHLRQRLRVGEVHEQVPGERGGEDQRVDLPPPPGLQVGDEPHLGEVDLAFHAGLTVQHPHRRVPWPEPALLGGETVQRPIRHARARPGRHHLDLHDRQAALHPPRDLRPPLLQEVPRCAPTAGMGRPH